MKLSLLSFIITAVPLVAATCNYQHPYNTIDQKWRLSTYSNELCIDETATVVKSGFGVWCINIPNDTHSFIFSVGGGYTNLNLESCQIFLKEGNSCGGKQVGYQYGSWKLSEMTAEEKKAGSAYVQCIELVTKRNGNNADDQDGEKIVRRSDAKWYKEVEVEW